MPTMPDVMTYVEHHLRAIVRQRGAVYAIEWFAPDDQPLGTTTFQADQVDRWRRDVSIDRAAAIRDFSTVILQPIGDRPLDRLFDKPSGGALTQHQALIDIDLRARGLADLPWEDLIDAQQRPAGALNLLVRRSSPTFPRIGGAPFRLPMRWTVIGDSVQPLQAIVEKTFYGHGQAEIQRGLQIGLAPRLFEVSGEAGAILPSELLYLGGAACAALQDWTPDRLVWALDQWQTRLLILEPDPTDTALLAALAHLADGLIDLGGPAVLITRGGNRPRFLEACLDSLIHDSTLEMAVVQAVHNRSMWGWSDFWPDRPAQTPIVLPPLVFGGGGGYYWTRRRG